MRRLVMVLPFFVLACGDQLPCRTCPMIAGAYLVSWQSGFPQDGCPTMGPRPVNLNFTQQGNQLSVLIGGEELRGTLYDTFDFSMLGGRSETTYSLRGRAVVGNTSATADGGTAQAPSPAPSPPDDRRRGSHDGSAAAPSAFWAPR